MTSVERSMGMTRQAYRFVTGAELDGVRRTDATWRRPGRAVIDDSGMVWRWHFLPRGQRAMWRVGVLVTAPLLAWSSWHAPAQTWVTIQALLALAVCVAAHWFWSWIRDVEVRHRYIGPLADVLASRWGFTPPSDPATWVTVHRDSRSNADHPVEITLPQTYKESDRQQEATAKLIARKARISVKAMDYEIDWEGDHPKFLVRAQEVPPEVVPFEMAQPYLEQATDTRYFLGLSIRDEPVFIDLDLDSPHIAFSFGSGGGKSTVIRLLAAQILRGGGRVVILDHAKEGDSHADWVYDDHGHLLPGVEFYTDTESVHEALISLEEERTRRSKVAHQAKRFKRPMPHFQRTLVVMEELNTGTPWLVNHWKRLRKLIKEAEGEEQPLTSPAVSSIAGLVNAGRAQRMNCAAVAQRFDAKVIGGGDVRSSFMIRALARFGEDARRMLIPTVDPKPRSSNHPGRMVLAAESTSKVVQAALLTPEETQEWALGGYRTVLEQGGVSDVEHGAVTTACSSGQQVQGSDRGHRTILELPPAPEPVPQSRKLTINEALEEGIVTGTYEAITKAIRRGGFPVDTGTRKRNALTYWEHELAELEERRARKSATSR